MRAHKPGGPCLNLRLTRRLPPVGTDSDDRGAATAAGAEPADFPAGAVVFRRRGGRPPAACAQRTAAGVGGGRHWACGDRLCGRPGEVVSFSRIRTVTLKAVLPTWVLRSTVRHWTGCRVSEYSRCCSGRCCPRLRVVCATRITPCGGSGDGCTTPTRIAPRGWEWHRLWPKTRPPVAGPDFFRHWGVSYDRPSGGLHRSCPPTASSGEPSCRWHRTAGPAVARPRCVGFAQERSRARREPADEHWSSPAERSCNCATFTGGPQRGARRPSCWGTSPSSMMGCAAPRVRWHRRGCPRPGS